jgi:hypothetical protein
MERYSPVCGEFASRTIAQNRFSGHPPQLYIWMLATVALIKCKTRSMIELAALSITRLL